MNRINLGIVSQTPMVRMLNAHTADTVYLSELEESEYKYTVGGVTPLIKAQLDELVRENAIVHATWFSLNPNAPRNTILSKRIKAVSVQLEEQSSKDYVNFKEDVWNNIHNISSKAFTVKEYLGYFRYNSRLARIMLEDRDEINLFEIHDFQQLLLGAMLGPAFPSILRWHIPFVPEVMNPKIKKFIINGMEGNDAVVVSTKRDLEGLIRAGYRGMAYQIYPHIDQTLWRNPDRARKAAVLEALGITPDDFLVVNVARMDPMKSQDDLIRAIALLKDRRIKLLLVGGGSFSSSSKGLGHPKSTMWLRKLKALTRRLNVEDRVIFAGSVDHDDLECIYSRMDLFVLPSRSEGFGLVTVEAWTYDVPAIVSSGAGVSELIIDGLNGFTFKAGDYREMSSKISKLYSDSNLRAAAGTNAHSMAMACYASTTTPLIRRVYEKTIEGFG